MRKNLLTQCSLCFAALVFLLLAACSSQEGPPAEPTITPTQFPTFAFSQPTEAPQVATAAAATAAAREAGDSGELVLDPESVERGQGRYVALECGSCHGENAEGGEAPTLIGYAATEADFINFMRTGGELGNDHRFPAERLSNSGIVNLYQYLRSLSAE